MGVQKKAYDLAEILIWGRCELADNFYIIELIEVLVKSTITTSIDRKLQNEHLFCSLNLASTEAEIASRARDLARTSLPKL